MDAAAAVPGSLVLVSNGVYSTGVRNIWGSANRLVVTNQVIVKAVNGPTVTHIVGRTPNGAQAIRCVYLGEGNVIDGFTLTGGATLYGSTGGIVDYLDSAGGVFCESRESIVTNCIVIENVSGGIYGGTVYGSIIATNSGGGAIGL